LRTANKALKVLKASALMNGRDKVEYGDLEELKYVFCVLNRQMEEELFNAVYEKHIGKIEEERMALKDMTDIEVKMQSIPTDFDGMSDQEFIGKMREINEYIHLLENMQSPTDAISRKKNSILAGLRQIVERNRDKLFNKKGGVNEKPKGIGDGTTKANDPIEGELVSDYEEEEHDEPF
jgi:hypothetical protein